MSTPYETFVRKREDEGLSTSDAQAVADMHFAQKYALRLLAALRMASRHVPRDAMEYSKGDHGDRIYVRDIIETALAAATGTVKP